MIGFSNASVISVSETVHQSIARTRLLRRTFFSIPIVYLFSLIIICLYRSGERKSILGIGSLRDSANAIHSSGADIGPEAKVIVQEFHRLEFRNGKPVWDVRARDARYYPGELVTYINEVALVVFRKRGQHVKVSAETAKLALSIGGLQKAELTGNLAIDFGDGMSVRADSGEFDSVKNEFRIPAQATIFGDGFSINGEGLTFGVETGIGTFSKNVRCEFKIGAKVPRGIPMGSPSRNAKKK